MAEIIPTDPAGPTTSEGFLADRIAFWSWFTRATTFAAAGVAVILVLLAYFLL